MRKISQSWIDRWIPSICGGLGRWYSSPVNAAALVTTIIRTGIFLVVATTNAESILVSSGLDRLDKLDKLDIRDIKCEAHDLVLGIVLGIVLRIVLGMSVLLTFTLVPREYQYIRFSIFFDYLIL